MARIRTIKPEFWTHEDLSALPEATHMLAAALLNHSDDEGYFNANPGLVKAACSPLREPSVSIHDSLISLVSVAYLRLGTGPDGKRYGQVITFDDHQRVNRPTPSKIKALHILWDGAVTAHAHLSEDSSPERKGKEQGTGKGTEQEIPSLRSGSSSTSSTTATATVDLTAGRNPADPADLELHRAQRRAQRLSAVTDFFIESYNGLMAKPAGKLPAVNAKVGRKTRLRQVERCLTTAAEICADQFGDKKITPEFCAMYFAACLEDDFANGTGPYSGDHANWRPDFEYLTRPAVMLKMFERATDQEHAA